jgi:hypothetical protein
MVLNATPMFQIGGAKIRNLSETAKIFRGLFFRPHSGTGTL